MLALDKRDFIYKCTYKNKEHTLHANFINCFKKDLINLSNYKELQAESNRQAIVKVKYFINKNNVSFVGLLTIMLIITVIYGSLL